MASERWRQVEEIFAGAVALPAAERGPWLTRHCGGDVELRREIESLLAADGAAGDFLERPAAVPETAPPESAVGRRIGPYAIERKLGEGGMSTVYVAARADEEYRQQVAIKVFGYGADRRDLVERFRAERQILALLDHPNIARLLDGGTTSDGLPYLVMEYIDGVPIDRYCDERLLSIEKRIELFRQVCSAVQYAHQNLVVHRDIKPSNILVTADGVPHLLDFGIAKLLEGSSLTRAAAATVTGQRLMTPHYASPEQVEGKPVTTATDVYSLGVLLYVLLAGRLPYRLAGDRLGEVEQAVLEQQPERPSVTAGRQKLARQLAGDLDNIVLTALRKEPTRRYASVELLAEDLRRHRTGLPVLARPSTVGYRVSKFVGRHRLGVGVAALLALVILGLAATMTVQAARLVRQRDEIRRERDKAVQVADFLEEIFSAADPARARGETVTAREVLDRGAARITAELADQPEVQAALAAAIGRSYAGLGAYDRAEALLDRSLTLRRKVFGASHPEIAESLFDQAALYYARGDLELAEATFRQVVQMRRALLGGTDPAVAEGLNGLGLVLISKAKFDAAEPVLREALAINRKQYGNDNEEVGSNLGNLGLLMKQKGDLAAAEALYSEALAIFRRLFDAPHPQVVIQLNNLAMLQSDRGEFAAAEASYRETLAVARRVYGREHPQTALFLANLAGMLSARGKHDEAERLARESLALRRRLLGDENEQVARGLNTLATILEEKGELAQARASYEESLRIFRLSFSAEHPRIGAVLANLANLLLQQGDPAAAEPLARQALAIRRRALGVAHPDVGSSLVSLGSIRLARGAAEEAEPLLRQGYETLRAALSEDHWRTADARSQLGACLAVRGKAAEAEPLLTSGYETLLATRGAWDRRTLAAGRRLNAFRRAA
ncbi:MAG TPA: serine/threonine-protein kinase [Thermoanaerobaculia bacterium]|jgi:serine/threonine-protein kinase|nr:serine/threonine-protein kinase [Thermoanaerobaculia bacterium]